MPLLFVEAAGPGLPRTISSGGVWGAGCFAGECIFSFPASLGCFISGGFPFPRHCLFFRRKHFFAAFRKFPAGHRFCRFRTVRLLSHWAAGFQPRAFYFFSETDKIFFFGVIFRLFPGAGLGRLPERGAAFSLAQVQPSVFLIFTGADNKPYGGRLLAETARISLPPSPFSTPIETDGTVIDSRPSVILAIELPFRLRAPCFALWISVVFFDDAPRFL